MSITSTLVKSAVVGALMLGNIAPPDDNYFESDADFNNLTSQLTTGWGWFKLSTANARACTSRIECIGIIGTTPPPVNPGPRPGIPPDPEPPEPPGDGGGSGGGNPPPGKDDPNKDKSACLTSALKFKTTCLANIGVDGGLVNRICDKVPTQSVKTRCKALLTIGTILGSGVCLTIDNYQKSQCDKLPDL